MRALRVVGITEDGSVVLEDPGRRERFTVPADEQLRAAARGDLTRLGQIAIELESQLRPREIQARIRAGASVEQVASAAGVPAQKIERFAYPVLLERTRTAEVARAAHPVRSDGPDVRTLGETVAHTFGLRGQDHTEADWDSWKGEDGKWVVALSWRAGRSDIRAHWTFQPGAHGGTVTALDEHASDLVEGLPQRPLRTVGPVIDIARAEEEQDRRYAEEARAEMVRAASGMGVRERPLGGSDTRSRSVPPEQRRPPPAPRRPEPSPVEEPASASAEETPDESPGAPAWNRAASTGVGDTQSEAAETDQPAGSSSSGAQPADTSVTGDPPVAKPAGVRPDLPEADPAPGAKPAAGAASPEPAPSAATDSEPTQAATISEGAPAATAGSAPTPATETGSARTPATSSEPTAVTGSEPTPAAAEAEASPAAEAPPSEAPAAETPAAAAQAKPAPASGAVTEPSPAPETPAVETPAVGTPAAEAPAAEAPSTAASPSKPAAAEKPAAEQTPPAPPKRTKKGKPVMPSWDEVLLGVRGQR
jgi:hypothetical protein